MIHILAIGKMRHAAERALFDRYAARIVPKLQLIEIDDAKGSPQEIKKRETQALLKALPDKALVVAMDEGGKAYNSLSFSEQFQQWQEQSRPICFLIGGSEGLDNAAIQRSEAVFSLGNLTWPHMLARILLVEQIYRAQSIIKGHPYHRKGRPV